MTETDSKKEYSRLSRALTGSSAVLFFMFILLKPYYLRPSGSIGAADVCLAAAGVVMLAAELMRISACADIHKKGFRAALKIYINEISCRQDIALYVFIVLAAIVNSIYSIRIGSQEYTKYTVYWVYNGLAIWTLRKLRDAYRSRNDAEDRYASPVESETGKGSCEFCRTCGYTFSSKRGKISAVLQYIRGLSFNDALGIMLEINIVIQFIIMLLGRGRYFVEYWGAVRYMGSFNDPNQLAFFIFVSMLLIYSLTGKKGRALHLQVNEAAVSRALDNGTGDICNSCLTEEYISQKINADNKDKIYISDEEHWNRSSEKLIGYIRYAVYILAIIIIIKTKSTGIMLGVAAFAFLSWCRWIWEAMRSGRISKKLIAAVVIVCAVCAAGLLIYIWPPADFDVKNVEYNTLTRIQEKLWKLSQGGVSGFLIDRGGGKLAAFPQYMLFGAGEGGFDRFAIAGQEINEIHCGPMSILFCYGIIPAVFMIKWLVDSLKRKNSRQLCACLALIAESMTLINYRQPMFWFLLM